MEKDLDILIQGRKGKRGRDKCITALTVAVVFAVVVAMCTAVTLVVIVYKYHINQDGKPDPSKNYPEKLHVTMHVFSGREDPSWEINQYHPKFYVIMDIVLNHSSTHLQKLGYRGFTLKHNTDGFSFGSGMGTRSNSKQISSHKVLESLLLESSSDVDDEVLDHARSVISRQGRPPLHSFKRHVKRRNAPHAFRNRRQSGLGNGYVTVTAGPTTIAETTWPSTAKPRTRSLTTSTFIDWWQKHPSTRRTWTRRPTTGTTTDSDIVWRYPWNLATTVSPWATKSCPYEEGAAKSGSWMSTSLPTYEPEKWNNYYTEESNNCYDYANNKRTYTFAQPGRASGYRIGYIPTGYMIESAAESDGLREVNQVSKSVLPDCDWNLVALVIWPGQDFHWYRLDDNARWSHKPGKTAAINIDDDGCLINDPRFANRGPYTQFVGFMKTRQDEVKIY